MDTTESAAPTDNAPAPETEQAKKKDDKLAVWSVLALLLGIAGDLVEPLGNISAWLFMAGIALVILCFAFGKRIAFLKRARMHSSIFLAIMAAVLVLQYTAPQRETAQTRGAIVTYVPFFGSIQTSLLSSKLDGAELELFRFQDTLRSASDGMRSSRARELYAKEESGAVRRGMIETMLDSGDPELQQMAILLRLYERRNSNLQLLPVNRDADDPLSRRLLGYSFYLYTVNIDSGKFDVAGADRHTDGTVTMQGVSIPLYISLDGGDAQPMSVDLKPGKNRVLTGMARLESGEKAEVELPLF